MAETDFGQVISSDARSLAHTVLERAVSKGLLLATAESCTGGLLATLLTDIPGLSHCFECGFVVYSDQAKIGLLGIPHDVIDRHGAVSRTTACQMAERALARCGAHFALSATGFAGPAGPGDEAGLVHIAVASTHGDIAHEEHHFGPLGRDQVRQKTLVTALKLLASQMEIWPVQGEKITVFCRSNAGYFSTI
ncbi:CinA family protein [Croceicoccus bisphenolivorans]|uniref:CinA family protein n=1 Tax=Croceicoccus bisphenolivorans TaxID=1783232 RepID=UPI000833D75C|nr:CinA family protein [Croceicoccus bisphenolivorans]